MQAVFIFNEAPPFLVLSHPLFLSSLLSLALHLSLSFSLACSLLAVLQGASAVQSKMFPAESTLAEVRDGLGCRV